MTLVPAPVPGADTGSRSLLRGRRLRLGCIPFPCHVYWTDTTVAECLSQPWMTTPFPPISTVLPFFESPPNFVTIFAEGTLFAGMDLPALSFSIRLSDRTLDLLTLCSVRQLSFFSPFYPLPLHFTPNSAIRFLSTSGACSVYSRYTHGAPFFCI